MELIAYNLKRIRLRKGMTQEELGNMVGNTRQYISKLENGKTMSTKMLDKLITALDVKPQSILKAPPKEKK